jgi:hypothetical protein
MLAGYHTECEILLQASQVTSLSVLTSLKVGEPVLRVPFAEALPALHRFGVTMFLAQMSRGRDIDTLEG